MAAAVLIRYGEDVARRIGQASTYEQALQIAASVDPSGGAREIVEEVYGEVVPAFAQAQYEAVVEDLGEDANEASWDGVTGTLIGGVSAKKILDSMDRTTRREALAILEKLLEEGRPEEFLPMFRVRAETRAGTIADTEVGRSMNRGMQAGTEFAAVQTNGNAVYTWNAVMDDATRATHRAANGRERREGGTFNVGGHECKHPHDVSLPASETANCRCWLTGRVERQGE